MLEKTFKPSSPRRGIRLKAAAVAIALGTIPVAIVGMLAYVTTSRSLRARVYETQQDHAVELADKLYRFMFERYGDIEVVASQPTFTNPRLSQATSAQDKQDLLNAIVEAYGIYDSLAIFDPQGRLILRSRANVAENQLRRDYFQKVLEANRPVISQPQISPVTGEMSLYLAAPILNQTNGQLIGVVRSRLPVSVLESLILNNQSHHAHIINTEGLSFVSSGVENFRENVFEAYPMTAEASRVKAPRVAIVRDPDGDRLLLAAAPTPDLSEEMPPLNWTVVIDSDPQTVFATSYRLMRTIGWGTLGTTVGVTLLAVTVSLIFTEPLVQRIASVVQTLVSASSEMAATVEQQERSLTQQAASVSQATATVEQLSRSARRSAEQAHNAEAQAQHVLQLAEDGENAVDRTLERTNGLQERIEALAEQMRDFTEQTQQISTISSLVSDLANQTNMLALNASVEAVRAGEAGKGFAVVAAEIRKLADQSRQSAQRIDLLVGSVQTAIATTRNLTQESTTSVNETTDFAHQTAEKFVGVREAIQQIVVGSQQIAANAQQQALAIEQLTEAMNALDRGANETASGISQTRSGSQQLNEAATSLQQMV